ncbi:tail fiber domain-containing protein [Flavobacteriaceae bacterium]|nr:tail fiber domain-containing protein [Flavobacteriaceae bacterium]
MKKLFTLCLLMISQITIAQEVWTIAENPVYFSSYTYDNLIDEYTVKSDTIRISQNIAEDYTIDLIISRSGQIDHDFYVNGNYQGEELIASWAKGSIDDYANLDYRDDWKEIHDNDDVKLKFDTNPNAVIHIMPFDIYIEYRLIAFHRDENKGVDEIDGEGGGPSNEGQPTYYNFYTNSYENELFAYVRGGNNAVINVSSPTYSFNLTPDTKYWPLDNGTYNNIRIIKKSNDDPASPFNHDAITDGVQISRYNVVFDDYENSLKNLLDQGYTNAQLGNSGKMLMFARVPYDLNLETELQYVPNWMWKHNIVSLYQSMFRYIGNGYDGRRFKTLVAVVNHQFVDGVDSYETELITEMQILDWGPANDDFYQFEYVRGNGEGNTEVGSSSSGVHYQDTTTGYGGLYNYNVDLEGSNGYRLSEAEQTPDNYGELAKSAVDLSNNTVAGNQGAIADFSLAAGMNTIADGFNSTVIGSYNTEDSSADANNFSLSNRAFVIGNGDANTRSDALTVLFDGTTTVAGELNVNSDMRLKTNIISLGATLFNVLKIDGKSYSMKRDAQQKTKIGLLAQDIQKVYPELVTEQNGILSVNYQGLVPVLINAIKEQQVLIESNTKLINQLLEKNENN